MRDNGVDSYICAALISCEYKRGFTLASPLGLKEVMQPLLGDPDLDSRRAVLAGLTAQQV